jgi:hypothetical protein
MYLLAKKALFLSLTFFYFTLIQAQNNVVLPQTSIKAAYMGSIVYPGFKVGIERPYKVIQVDKTRKSGTKTILKEHSLTFNLGYYHHETFHTNIYLLAEWQLRKQRSKGWFTEFAPGLGYSRTFLDGTAYRVDDNGQVTKMSISGYNYAMLSIAGGFGYDFSKQKDLPIKAYFKPSLIVMAPYNTFIYFRPTVEVGVVYTPANFWAATPKVKLKTKDKK